VGIVKEIIEERELSFWDHLDVLRWLIVRVVIAWVILAVGFFIIMPDFFDKIILAPCYNDFVFYDCLRWIGQTLHLDDPFFSQDGFEVHLQNINLASQFFVHITTSFLMAVVVTAPYLVYEIWRFVRPALYPNELKGVRKAFSLGTIFFFLGVAVGYFMIFPLALRFLSTYQLSTAIENEISLNSYIDNFMMLVLMMGVAFELPLVTWLLSLLGLVTRSFLREYRRHAFLVIVIFAAIITPTGDPFTLSAVALPLYLLYELSIFMVKDKKDEEDEEEEDAKESEKKDDQDDASLKQIEKKPDDPKGGEAKALPAAEGNNGDSEGDETSPEDDVTAEDTSESAGVFSPGTPTTTPIPEESEFTPEAAPSDDDDQYEEEYYLENDELKVRMKKKEVPVTEGSETPVDGADNSDASTTADSSSEEASSTVSSESAPNDSSDETGASLGSEPSSKESTAAEVSSAPVAPIHQIREEDWYSDGGLPAGIFDTAEGQEYAATMAERDAAEVAANPLAAEAVFEDQSLNDAQLAAKAAKEAAEQAAKAAKDAADAALKAAERAAEAAREAARRAEEVLAEAKRRAALQEAEKKVAKHVIDVKGIRYDYENLP